MAPCNRYRCIAHVLYMLYWQEATVKPRMLDKTGLRAMIYTARPYLNWIEERSTKPTAVGSSPAGRATQRRQGLIRDPAFSYLRLTYLLLTLMALGLLSSALGNVSVSTPFSKTASTLSACIGTFNVSVRANAP